MIQNVLHKTFSVALALLVFFSTVSFTVEKHFCGDVLVDVSTYFQLPNHERLIHDIHSRKISIKEGVAALFKGVSHQQINEMKQYISSEIKLREGFEDFMFHCECNSYELDIVSGGIDLFIEHLLPFFPPSNIYCNQLIFSNGFSEVTSEHQHETCTSCGCCKVRFLKENRFEIVIGDSVTDMYSARLADMVFARGSLIELCKSYQIAYHPYETFHDIISVLESM